MTELDRIRTDVVGSLLRPPRWKAARAGMEQGSTSKADFARIELDCVRENVALQEGIGLDAVTDGEVGRLNFQDSFGLAVSGYETGSESLAEHERRAAGGAPLARFDMPDLAGAGTPVVHRRPVSRRLKLERNVPLEEFKKLTKFPMQMVWGDNIDKAGNYANSYKLSVLFAEKVNKYGGKAQVFKLTDAGLKGNTHIPFADMNNLAVADLLSKFLAENGLDKR